MFFVLAGPGVPGVSGVPGVTGAATGEGARGALLPLSVSGGGRQRPP